LNLVELAGATRLAAPMQSARLPIAAALAGALSVLAACGPSVPRPLPEWEQLRAGRPGGSDAGPRDGGLAVKDAGPELADGGALGDDGGALDDSGPRDDDDAGPGGEEVPVQMRGVWITRFGYSTEADLKAVLERSAAAGFNAAFVQVRGNGDAYYNSNLEPWAARLTASPGVAGVLGRDPGWDPLAVALEHGHSLGLEVHAYMNALAGWAPADQAVPFAEGPHQHPLFTHPEWAAVTPGGTNLDAEYVYLSAANPAVVAHTAAVVADLLTHYAVDGVHLDRIRMPGSNYSHDAVATARFAAAQANDPTLTFPVFMREAVNDVVAAVFDALIATRPEAKLSAAVWGIYERFEGCTTSQGKADYHQDSIAWVQGGYMDALVPMIYWPEEPGACTDFRALTADFVQRSGDKKVWAGVHALEIRQQYTFDAGALAGRLEAALDVGAEGSVIFASTYFEQDNSRYDALLGDEAAPGPFFEATDPPGPALR
jgi:uncharacterized lipoprotein YddW (UPF0748 family)